MNGVIKKFKKKSSSHRQPKIYNSGFTLIELLVVIAMISVMLAALVGLFTTLSKSYTTEEVRADAQQDVRAATDLMVRDIRMAGLDPTLSGNFGIEDATSTRIRFTMDTETALDAGDYNGSVDNTRFERITYELNVNQLNQILYETTASVSTQPVIDNVTALTFTYLDEDGNTIAAPVSAANLPNIREIQLTMTVQLPAGLKGTVTRTLNTRIQIRNLWF